VSTSFRVSREQVCQADGSVRVEREEFTASDIVIRERVKSVVSSPLMGLRLRSKE
jgi:hypothetical protein